MSPTGLSVQKSVGRQAPNLGREPGPTTERRTRKGGRAVPNPDIEQIRSGLVRRKTVERRSAAKRDTKAGGIPPLSSQTGRTTIAWLSSSTIVW